MSNTWSKISWLFKIFSLIIAVTIIGFLFFLSFAKINPEKQAEASILNEDKILELINIERKKINLSNLVRSPKLEKSAYQKAKDMSDNQYFSHYRPTDNKRGLTFIIENDYEYEMAGENLAIYFDEAEELVSDWMSSPGHRQNILKPEFTETGIGIYKGFYEGFETNFVVQFFARPLLVEVESFKNSSEQTKSNLVSSEDSSVQESNQVESSTQSSQLSESSSESQSSEVYSSISSTESSSKKVKVIIEQNNLANSSQQSESKDMIKGSNSVYFDNEEHIRGNPKDAQKQETKNFWLDSIKNFFGSLF